MEHLSQGNRYNGQDFIPVPPYYEARCYPVSRALYLLILELNNMSVSNKTRLMIFHVEAHRLLSQCKE
jgi:hypothetical protein